MTETVCFRPDLLRYDDLADAATSCAGRAWRATLYRCPPDGPSHWHVEYHRASLLNRIRRALRKGTP